MHIDSLISWLGIDFELKKLEVSNKLVTVQLWDTAGQERCVPVIQTGIGHCEVFGLFA